MAKQIVLTKAGLEALEKELEVLKTVKRAESAAKIKEALSFGDLSENSEYDEAKNEQAMMESRIAEIEATLKNVKVIDEDSLSTDYVQHGNKAKVKDLSTGEIYELCIVGSGAKEIDPMNGKISDECPIGKALLHHGEGDIVDVEEPSGIVQFEILEITK